MSEVIKTLIYAGISLAVLAAALIVRFAPSGHVDGKEDILGTELFPDFKDPLEAQSLEIAFYDEVLNQVNRFMVQRTSGRWTIPSHDNYPADADERMRNAATSLMGLEILGAVTDRDSDHAKYGVVEPDERKLERGATGIGALISFKDAKGAPLAQLIIGAAVENSPGTRYVRVLGQSQVFETKIDLSKVSIQFEDWIEKDLLQVEPSNIELISFNDYTVTLPEAPPASGMSRLRQERRLKLTVNKDDEQWRVREMKRFDEQGQAVDLPLAASEELNGAQLERLTQALDALAIVDVRRKPRELTGDTFLELGFVSVQIGDHRERLAKYGELVFETGRGVQYRLWFGVIADSRAGSDLGKLNRYLMVSCEVSEEKFPKPAPPKLPELPDAKSEAAEDKTLADDDDPALDRVRIEAERTRLQRAYETNLAVWRDQRRDAAEKVRALQARFEDWCFVIPNDAYERIRLGRGQLIRERSDLEGDGVDAFRYLEANGPALRAKE